MTPGSELVATTCFFNFMDRALTEDNLEKLVPER